MNNPTYTCQASIDYLKRFLDNMHLVKVLVPNTPFVDDMIRAGIIKPAVVEVIK